MRSSLATPDHGIAHRCWPPAQAWEGSICRKLWQNTIGEWFDGQCKKISKRTCKWPQQRSGQAFIEAKRLGQKWLIGKIKKSISGSNLINGLATWSKLRPSTEAWIIDFGLGPATSRTFNPKSLHEAGDISLGLWRKGWCWLGRALLRHGDLGEISRQSHPECWPTPLMSTRESRIEILEHHNVLYRKRLFVNMTWNGGTTNRTVWANLMEWYVWGKRNAGSQIVMGTNLSRMGIQNQSSKNRSQETGRNELKSHNSMCQFLLSTKPKINLFHQSWRNAALHAHIPNIAARNCAEATDGMWKTGIHKANAAPMNYLAKYRAPEPLPKTLT